MSGISKWYDDIHKARIGISKKGQGRNNVHNNASDEDVQPSSPPPLRVQIASDLHIEFYNGRPIPEDIIVPRAPILALLGDIGLAFMESLRAFLHQQADRFERVLFLAGNHEFYNVHRARHSVSEQREWMRAVCDERENLHFLDNTAIDLLGVRVLGTTLWSNVPDRVVREAEGCMNDYQLSYNHDRVRPPRKLRAEETTQWHRDSAAWLERELDEAQDRRQPVLVLTHHTPRMQGTSDPKYDESDLNHCFSTDLAHLMSSPAVTAWACGHTHYNFDFTVNGVRLVSNQRGYPENVNDDYSSDGLVLEIPSSWNSR